MPLGAGTSGERRARRSPRVRGGAGPGEPGSDPPGDASRVLDPGRRRTRWRSRCPHFQRVDTVPQGLLAGEALAAQGQGIAAAEALLAAESVPVATTTSSRACGQPNSPFAAGEGLLVLEAGGAAEVEAAVGPVGWIVGAVVLVAAGGLLLTADPSSASAPQTAPQTQPPTGANAPVSPEVRALLDPSPLVAAAAPMTAPRARPVTPAGMHGGRAGAVGAMRGPARHLQEQHAG